MEKIEQNHRDLWDTIKCTSMSMGITKRERRQERVERIHEECPETP
jgi:hypothetical protein